MEIDFRSFNYYFQCTTAETNLSTLKFCFPNLQSWTIQLSKILRWYLCRIQVIAVNYNKHYSEYISDNPHIYIIKAWLFSKSITRSTVYIRGTSYGIKFGVFWLMIHCGYAYNITFTFNTTDSGDWVFCWVKKFLILRNF